MMMLKKKMLMLKKKMLFIVVLVLSSAVFAQSTGALYDFNNGLEGSLWGSSSSILTESLSGQEIVIESNGAGPNEESSYFYNTSNPLDMSNFSSFSIDIKSDAPINIRIDLVDENGFLTNKEPIKREVKEADVWTTLKFDFNGKFKQEIPASKTVDKAKIIGIHLYINFGGQGYTGNVYVDNLAFGDQAARSIGNGIPGVKVNQLGFYPTDEKIAIASSTSSNTFLLKNEDDGVVYTGTLGEMKYWSYAQDCVKVADFSDFTTKGRYKVVVDGIPNSTFFDIKDRVHEDLAKASLKYYYYNRLSIPIEEEYAGKWARQEGHPDDVVYIHSSAATEEIPEGTIVSGSKGWYDAGDYNKYIINSGITTYTLMALYERFWRIYDHVDLNIPESSNNVPDILDEVKWNLDWMLSMQDPNDGGVYFKLTSKNFTGDIMPHQDLTDRYMVGKSTASSLDFAAVMATAYRIYKPFEAELPGFADTCLHRAYRAYEWAKENDNISFSNPSDISTGEYGDWSSNDEFVWAATELYIASKDDVFYNDIDLNLNAGIPGWQTVTTLAYMSLSHNKDHLTEIADVPAIKAKIASAISTRKNGSESSAYKIPMSLGNNDFYWGSNAVAANISMVLLQDYYNTGDDKSFVAAKSNLDYLLGRNPLELCFVTGFGTNSPLYPHHRPSVADGITAPVPGMLVGGPNKSPSDDCEYLYDIDALSYTDQTCSYSTNEIAINWNAPLAFLTGAVEAQKRGISPSYKYYQKGWPMAVQRLSMKGKVKIYPNPAINTVSISLEEGLEVQKIELISALGEVYYFETKQLELLDVSMIPKGAFVFKITTNLGVITEKVSLQ